MANNEKSHGFGEFVWNVTQIAIVLGAVALIGAEIAD
jgi:hypothetical protein